MSELENAAKEAIHTAGPAKAPKDEWPLNSWVAGLVAVVATCMAVGNIKDGNVVQAMQLKQAKSVDTWSYYQSKSTKQHIAENAADQMKVYLLVSPTMAPLAKTQIARQIAKYEAEAQRYDQEKAEIRKQAEGYEKDYERLNHIDDQFDMSDACFSVSIALFGVTALTRKRWLFFFALALGSTGLVLELSGFLGWRFHPEWLARILG